MGNLSDFKFNEVTYTDIQIQQPEIVNGVEKTRGQIIITIPGSADELNLSLASVNFDESKFTISPKVGSVQSFEEGSVIVYTITSLENPEKSMCYLVSVVKTGSSIEELKITGFIFEQSKNSGLPMDIEAVKIVEYPVLGVNAIFVLVPVDTDLTNLVPTIYFEGETLTYKQGDSGFVPYPITALKVDFTSNYDFISWKDKNQFFLSVNSSGKQKKYRVIVDIENPVDLQQNSVSTMDVTEGTSNISFIFENWIHKGNHPILTNIKAIDFIDNTTNSIGNILSKAYLEPANGISSFIMPGQEGRVRVIVDANEAVIGDYDVDIVFSPKYDVNRAFIWDEVDDLNPVEDIFTKVELNVKTKVISR